MKYILLLKGQVVAVTDESPYTGTPKLKEFDVEYDQAVDMRGSDMKSFEEAEKYAEACTKLTGETYLAFDNGAGTSHRYGIMVPPKVGDDVSYGFNGDYYPCGKVVRITPGWRIYTSDDTKSDASNRKHLMFNRKGKTSGWKMKGGTWGLVKGIVDERNPSF